MAKRRKPRSTNPKTKMFNKGFQQAAKKQDYLVGDFVMDVATIGLWSLGRRALRK